MSRFRKSDKNVTKVTMELKDRIATIIRVNNHTASSFADLLGVQRSSISHVLNGRNKPSLDFIEKVLINFPRVDPGWLITGKDPESKKSASVSPKPKFQEVPEQVSTEVKLKPQINSESGNKRIEKIVIFYSDRTFETYEQD